MKQLCRPRNWDEFQHYKDRRPPWVKIHRSLLDDREYLRLPVASRALAPMLWLLASESEVGLFDASIEELTFRLRQPAKEIEAGLKPLVDAGFFVLEHVASTALAECLHVAVPEERRGETETETDASNKFASFWSAYPKKTAKPAAAKAFKAVKAHEHLDNILEDLERRKSSDAWQKEGGQYVPNPSSYLNQRRWEDELPVNQPARSALLAGVI